jgi:AcrR family transcriptional regulator
MPRAKNTSRQVRRIAPSQERGERRVAQILDAAAAILAERGYDALTLSDVAERSHSATGSLYRFFASKQQLVAALVDRVAVAFAAAAEAELAAPPTQLDVSAFVAWYLGFVARTVKRHPDLPPLLEHLGAHCKPIEDRTVAPIRAYFAANAPELTALDHAVASRIVLELLKAGFALPNRVSGASRADASREIALALTSYLQAKVASGSKK